jgi:hypothetical protein
MCSQYIITVVPFDSSDAGVLTPLGAMCNPLGVNCGPLGVELAPRGFKILGLLKSRVCLLPAGMKKGDCSPIGVKVHPWGTSSHLEDKVSPQPKGRTHVVKTGICE